MTRMRLVTTIVMVVAGAFAGCVNRLDVQCEQNSNCDLSGGGVCATAETGNRWCAYPDPVCPTGYRYSTDDVGDGVSGVCVTVATDASADWVTRHGGPGDDRGVAIAAAPNGDIVMTGTFTGTMTLGGPTITSAGGRNTWVARYRADGTHLWSIRLGDGAAIAVKAVAVEGNGDVYVAGNALGSVSFGGGVRTGTFSGFLVKLSGGDGAYRWDRVFGVGFADGVAILDASNIAVCGAFLGTVDFGGGPRTSTPANGFDNFVATYSTDFGAHMWSTVLMTSGSNEGACGLAAVGGDVVVTAGFDGTAMLGGSPLTAQGSEDIYVARYRGTNGAHVWSMRQGGSGAAYSGVIATDGSHLFVGGEFSGTVNLGGFDLDAANSLFPDAFVASYNASDGSHVWSERFGGIGHDMTTSIASSSTRLAVGINFDDTFTIGTRTFKAESDEDVAIARLNPSTGAPSATSTQFASSTSASIGIGSNKMALVYTSDRLVGVGTFSGSTNLLGTNLLSAGDHDIACFRVDF